MGWYDRKVRRVRDLSCGDTRIFLELEVRRIECRRCGKVKRERLDFLADNPLYTKRFAYFVGRRCRGATIKEVAEELAKLKRSRPSDIKEAEARVEEARQEWILRKNGYRQEDRARAKAVVDAVVDAPARRVSAPGAARSCAQRQELAFGIVDAALGILPQARDGVRRVCFAGRDAHRPLGLQ
jgi:transposase